MESKVYSATQIATPRQDNFEDVNADFFQKKKEIDELKSKIDYVQAMYQKKPKSHC